MSEIQRRKSSCICINLRRAAQALTVYYDEALRPRGLTVSQYSLLRNLGQSEACSVSALAGYTGLERSTLVRNLAPLFAGGYIADSAAPGSRNRSIHITRAGEKILTKCLPLWSAAQEAVRKKIGARRVDVLTDLLSRLESL
jgi:DNA-binding MarR family transcriptional regulator